MGAIGETILLKSHQEAALSDYTPGYDAWLERRIASLQAKLTLALRRKQHILELIGELSDYE